jgi:hypothetical protein
VISPPPSVHYGIGCALMRAISIYQSLCPSLHSASFPGLLRRNRARFIRSFNQLKYKFVTEEMHICQT